jgi:phage terminase large subunit-like protein
VKLACQRQLDDLARAAHGDVNFPYRFDISKAERVCLFIEQLPHIEGPLTGQNIRLEPWQCFILTTVFGWVHARDDKSRGIVAGKRRFRRVYVEVARGNGKSSLSAGVALFMLTCDGEGGAQVYSTATSVNQAMAVYRPAEEMVRKTEELQEHFGVSIAARRLNVQSTASFFRALPYKPGVLDGLNVHLAIVDELHAHKIRTVYEVLESGLGKRLQSLLWTITTAGFDRAGICFEKHTYIQSILSRNVAATPGGGLRVGVTPEGAVMIKFSLGRIVATPAVLEAFKQSGDSPDIFILRHSTGNWGDLSAEDKRLNDQALIHGGRLLSAYHLSDGTKIWIISEADRASSCILLPEDY